MGPSIGFGPVASGLGTDVTLHKRPIADDPDPARQAPDPGGDQIQVVITHRWMQDARERTERRIHDYYADASIDIRQRDQIMWGGERYRVATARAMYGWIEGQIELVQ